MQPSVLTSASFIAIKQVLMHLVEPGHDELEAFLQLFKPRCLEDGDYLIRAGEISTEVAFINSGLLRLFYQNDDGKELNKSFITENEFAAAYSAFLTHQPAHLNIQALHKTHLLVANISSVIALFDQYPCWAKLGRILAEQLYIKKETREAEFLLDDAETRYHNFQKQYPGLEDRLAQYHVASYLGISPVMLSRIRRR